MCALNNFDRFLMKTLILYQLACTQWRFNVDYYENTPIQIYRKFHLQKPKIFR